MRGQDRWLWLWPWLLEVLGSLLLLLCPQSTLYEALRDSSTNQILPFFHSKSSLQGCARPDTIRSPKFPSLHLLFSLCTVFKPLLDSSNTNTHRPQCLPQGAMFSLISRLLTPFLLKSESSRKTENFGLSSILPVLPSVLLTEWRAKKI